MTKWLVYDIGTTGTKAALMQGGHILQSVTYGYATDFKAGGIVEQQAEDWWQTAITATRALSGTAEAQGLIFTGQMQDLILLDGEGKPLRPVILYNDTRAHAEIQQVIETIGADTLRHLTGNHQDAGSLLAKLRWLLLHEPETLHAAQHLLLGAADFITARLTGQYRTDHTTASTTGLLDVLTLRYIEEDLMADIGLTEISHLLPSIIAGGTRVGSLLPEMADLLGLPADLPVYLAPGDAGCATIGANSGEPGSAYAYIGTSGWVAFTDSKPANPDNGVITLAHPRGGNFIAVAPLMTAAGNLDWVQGLFGMNSSDELVTQALNGKTSGLVYLPYLNGERAPFSDPFARGVFIGLSTHTNQTELVRAVLEGVALAYRHTLDALMPPDLEYLTLTGGGTASLEWCQLFADVLHIPIRVAADAANAGLRGAVRAVEVMSGQADSYLLADMPIAHELTPRSELRQLYDQKYAVFRQSYYALKPLFRALHVVDTAADHISQAEGGQQ